MGPGAYIPRDKRPMVKLIVLTFEVANLFFDLSNAVYSKYMYSREYIVSFARMHRVLST